MEPSKISTQVTVLPQITATNMAAIQAAGYDMNGVARRVTDCFMTPIDDGDVEYDLVIVGTGAGGIAVAASLKVRKPGLEIAIIDPAGVQYHQPGRTMVRAGIFEPHETAKTVGSLIPQGVSWIIAAVVAFEPKNNAIVLDGCRVVTYDRLVVCPGHNLDLGKVEGLGETLGQNGVTSIYRFDRAPHHARIAAQRAGTPPCRPRFRERGAHRLRSARFNPESMP